MSESLRDLVVSLSLDSDNFSRNLTSINRQIQEAESEFKRAASGVDGFEKSVAGCEAKLSMLQQKLSLQQKAVQQYEKALAAAEKKLQNSYDKQGKLNEALDTARQKNTDLKDKVAAATDQYERFRRELGEDNSATIAVKENLDALNAEYAESSQEVKKLEGQLAANQRAMQNNADAVTRANTTLNNARSALQQTEQQIQSTTDRLARLRSAWTQASESLQAFSTRCAAVAQAAEKTGRTMSRVFTTPILALGTASFKAAMDFESAFTGVRKTVDATEAEYEHLSDSIKRMSTEIATSTTDIAGVMENAGQLGITNDNLESFTRTMIDLGNSTDIAADEAATAIAQFANVTGMAQSQFSNFGSALVDLGNNYATTESAIMNMATNMASAGAQVGLSEAQILGFAAALSSVGLEAQAGGTAFSKAMIKMQVAVETGGQALTDFAKVSGMTEDAFKQLWKSDPSAAIQAFIVGLSKMDEQGVSAIATLQEMGFNEVRLRDTLLRATNATELFSSAQETATNAWEENVALFNEANKRYATTESRLKNLKNTAVLAAQQIGQDLTPTIQKLIDGAKELLERFMALDSGQRQLIIRIAAIVAAAGPVLLIFSKITAGIGTISGGLAKFAGTVAAAGGGWGGFMKTLASSPSVWVALGVAVIAATVAIADYVSGAKEAREALKGMAEAAEEWKNTAADTFYGRSDGLSAFGMDKSAFTRATTNAQGWMNGLIAVWTDGQKETDEIVTQWTDSWKELTSSTRTELESLKAAADQAGYTSVSDDLAASIRQLDSMDAEIERLLKKRQNGFLTDDEKIRLQELIDTRHAIEVKYNLTPADTDGFATIEKKVEAAVARAQAMGKSDADMSVYQDAIVATAEGMAAINAELAAQYEQEYAVIQLIEDAGERQVALDELNARYNADRRAAALEYAETLSNVVTPVWNQESIQQAKDDVGDLFTLLRKYSLASESDKPAILTEMKNLSQEMDEASLTEYLSLLTQIQSLMDEGLTESEIQDMFPDIDVSGALDQFAGIATYLDLIKTDLPGLYSMFNESLPEEVLTIATDLDMTGAQERWNEFASNPGAITTDAIINSYTMAENAAAQQPHVDAFIDAYTEVPEGASTAQLTPTGILAYVNAYAEANTGTDVSALTPENITAMVSGYKELASGADVSTLKPSEITAYIMKYLEGEGVDTSALTPEAVTAFVLAYEEITGGASTAALTPDGITAMVAKYLQAEGVDITALSPDQVNAIVSKYSEATGCDKSELLTSFTAYITEYKEAEGVTVPRVQTRVFITGYDFMAYSQFGKDNPDLELEVPVRLGELQDGELESLLNEGKVKVWQDGVEIPIESVPEGTITADTIASLDTDGTLHILITPELSGSEEAISEFREAFDEIDNTPFTVLSTAGGALPLNNLNLIEAAIRRISEYQSPDILDRIVDLFGGDRHGLLDDTMKNDFSPERVAELSAYVAEVVTAIKNGEEVSQEDIENLQLILTFLNGLDTTDTGAHIREGIAQGMVEAGWDTDAESVASDLETALNSAFIISSPSARMKPIGEYVAAGIGEGAAGYDFSTDAATIASAVETALNARLTATSLTETGNTAMSGLAGAMTGYNLASAGTPAGTNAKSAISGAFNASALRPIGVSAMNGLVAGINAGRSAVISAMRQAARAAVSAAKSELQIHSPSRVFRDEVGAMTMRGFGEGITEETEAQARIIRNAARYITQSAQSGAVGFGSTMNKTYNQNSTVNLNVDSLQVRDSQDVHSLAVEIASLTKRQQRGKGLRLA